MAVDRARRGSNVIFSPDELVKMIFSLQNSWRSDDGSGGHACYPSIPSWLGLLKVES